MMNSEARKYYNEIFAICNRKQGSGGIATVRVDLISAADCLRDDANDWSGCAWHLATAIKTSLNDGIHTELLLDIARIQRRILKNVITTANQRKEVKSNEKLRLVSNNGESA